MDSVPSMALLSLGNDQSHVDPSWCLGTSCPIHSGKLCHMVSSDWLSYSGYSELFWLYLVNCAESGCVQMREGWTYQHH